MDIVDRLSAVQFVIRMELMADAAGTLLLFWYFFELILTQV
jgi:hypothetical protein